LANRNATIARVKLATSLRLWPASEISAREFRKNPAPNSMTTNRRLRRIPMINALLTPLSSVDPV